MKRRIFIAINLPDETKKELASSQRKLKKLDIRWTKKENLHFTLAFIGWVDEGKIETIKEIVKKVAQEFSPFLLRLTKIILGPDSRRPRMIWAEGEASKELAELVKRLREALTQEKIFVDQKHSFKIHLTLARARGKELFGRKIDKKIDLVFSVNEIAITESKLEMEGVKYGILETCSLRSRN